VFGVRLRLAAIVPPYSGSSSSAPAARRALPPNLFGGTAIALESALVHVSDPDPDPDPEGRGAEEEPLALVVLTLRSAPGPLLPDPDRALDREFVSDLARNLASASALVLARDRYFVSDLARNLATAFALTLDLDLADDRTLAFADDLVRDLNLVLDLARNLGRDLLDQVLARDHILVLARDLARVLVLARDLDQVLVRDLVPARGLLANVNTRARANARNLANYLDRALDRGLVLALADARALARAWALALSPGPIRVRDLVDAFADVRLDASGVDLSALRFPDLEVLAGVVWSDETVWPEGVAELVRARSEQIGYRVWQVRGGSEREPSALVPG
jgi:hypothetical protein